MFSKLMNYISSTLIVSKHSIKIIKFLTIIILLVEIIVRAGRVRVSPFISYENVTLRLLLYYV